MSTTYLIGNKTLYFLDGGHRYCIVEISNPVPPKTRACFVRLANLSATELRIIADFLDGKIPPTPKPRLISEYEQ